MSHAFSLHTLPILGAIIGDYIGSRFERNPIKSTSFDILDDDARFTDDSVMVVAVADALLGNGDYSRAMRQWGNAFPLVGYGERFGQWLKSPEPRPYQSYGNGSAMRAVAIGCAFDTLEETLAEAKRSALPTHDHQDGILGAQAVALAVFLARTLHTKKEIRTAVENHCGYPLRRKLWEVRDEYTFDITCAGSVPESILCFLEARNYEQAVRNAVSLGGDADTMACIAGGIAAAYFQQIPDVLMEHSLPRLHPAMIEVIGKFEKHFHRSARLARSRTLDLLLQLQNEHFYHQHSSFITAALQGHSPVLSLEELLRRLCLVSSAVNERERAEAIRDSSSARRCL